MEAVEYAVRNRRHNDAGYKDYHQTAIEGVTLRRRRIWDESGWLARAATRHALAKPD